MSLAGHSLLVGVLSAALFAGCGGDEQPTSVAPADLEETGEFWNSLTPDLKEELVETGKDELGEERPDGASVIQAVDDDQLVEEIDQEYANEAKRSETIYETYRGANDELAQENLDELIPQLQDEGNAP